MSAIKEGPLTKWEVIFKLPFEYTPAISFLANGISTMRRAIDYQLASLAGDVKQRFEKIEKVIDNLEKRLIRLEEKHKHILKEEEEDYEEDW